MLLVFCSDSDIDDESHRNDSDSLHGRTSGHELRVLIASVVKRVDYANQFRQFEMLFLLPDDLWLRDGRPKSANGFQFRASGS